MLFFSLGGVPVSVCVLTTGVVIRRRAASGEDGTRRFWFGGFFHMLGSGWHEGVSFPGYVPPQERTARGGFPLALPRHAAEHVSEARERVFYSPRCSVL